MTLDISVTDFTKSSSEEVALLNKSEIFSVASLVYVDIFEISVATTADMVRSTF